MNAEDTELPYLALVGCNGMPTWSETAVAYTTFYHQLCRGEHISVAADLMRTASGNKDFYMEHAENSRKFYIDYIQSIDVEEVQEILEQNLEQEPVEKLDVLKKLSM